MAVTMRTSSQLFEDKVAVIRSGFADLVGEKIHGYQTAELLGNDGEWSEWADLPIRLFFSDGRLVSISWSRFDDLWLATDFTLPFSTVGSVVRWVDNSIEQINAAVGAMIRSVKLGRGQFSIEGQDVEIWTRLLIQVDTGWLEIFNALDENGYAFHLQHPAGDFVPCA